MAQPAVTLAEFRAHLNVTEADGHADDEEMWSAVLAAADQIDYLCGPTRPKSQTSRVDSWTGVLLLPVFPVISLTSITPVNGSALDLTNVYLDTLTGEVKGSALYGTFNVVYTVGRSPIPQALMTATLILAKLTWNSQRGPSAVNRFRGVGDTDAAGMSSGLDKYRADRLMDPYRLGRI
jgi:hypothetical protein